MKMNLMITKINMKTKIKFITAAILMLSLASCAEDIANYSTKKSEEGTVFVGGKTDINEKNRSRTVLAADTLTGNDLSFLWTYDDKIYLADGTVSAPWNKGLDRTTAVADFVFRGKSFTESSYDIYFPGSAGTVYNKVNIPSEDNGILASNIGTHDLSKAGYWFNNDCGFAKATRQPDGKYFFTLEHQSAFIRINPYVSTRLMGVDLIIRGFRITAEKNIAGEFTITPNGLVGEGSSKTVTLNSTYDALTNLNYVRHIFDGSKKNRGIWNTYMFQLRPVNSKLKIETAVRIDGYKVSNSGSFDRFQKNDTIIKYIPLHEYKMNTITHINLLLSPCPTYSPKYYVWDSAEDKELGHLLDNAGKKWFLLGNVYNSVPFNVHNFINTTSGTASRSAKNCPNKIEAIWYASHGDPHWDEQNVWTNGVFYHVGGVWLKKKSEIPGFSSTNLPSDVNITGNAYINTAVKRGTPTDTSKYFFLPSQGYLSPDFYSSQIGSDIAQFCKYWTKDAYDSDNAWYFLAYSSGVHVRTYSKVSGGYCLWTAQ